MRKRLPFIIAYIALLVLSLPIPLLHYRLTERAIEALRPVLKLSDGSYEPMLMPVGLLMLRWVGQLSYCVPIFVLALFLLSFWWKTLSEFTTICAIAICQCAFATFYALTATLALVFYSQGMF